MVCFSFSTYIQDTPDNKIFIDSLRNFVSDTDNLLDYLADNALNPTKNHVHGSVDGEQDPKG